ncbi:MAG: acetyl-CoA carboxylase biotin carboxyl carrier protein subunit [Flavobacterium sp.]|nr:acetyl-CoA carboxylase biotin carboxyl carrier protein subunit [Pedobacter sp.]
MYEILINKKFKFLLDHHQNQTIVNHILIGMDTSQITTDHFHIIHNHKSYRAEIVRMLNADKVCVIKINNHIYNVELKDQYDNLLQQMGMDNLNKVKILDLKAPMPGLVLKILVVVGQEVKKGDNLIVLEAMKMENIIKSPSDLKIKLVKVNTSDKVEKGQTLIMF